MLTRGQLTYSSFRYYTTVCDVLTSVRKMEESMMRLQKLRSGKFSSGNLSSLAAANQTLSDDDKIRLQLYLDVVSFGKQVCFFLLDPNSFQRQIKYTLIVLNLLFYVDQIVNGFLSELLISVAFTATLFDITNEQPNLSFINCCSLMQTKSVCSFKTWFIFCDCLF